MTHSTKQRMLDAGLAMLLEHGYNDLGIQALLDATGTPKGSFYHHFASKEDFALQVIDQYMLDVHGGLDACLGEAGVSARSGASLLRDDATELPQGGLHGLPARRAGTGAIGRERGVPAQDRECLSTSRSRRGLHGSGAGGSQIPPDTDVKALATLLVDCWEGAALRSRLRRNAAPLSAMLDFMLRPVAARGRASRSR